MPTIFEKDGFKFFFYSNEHRPIHVHVRYGGGEAVFELGKSGGVARVAGTQAARIVQS